VSSALRLGSGKNFTSCHELETSWPTALCAYCDCVHGQGICERQRPAKRALDACTQLHVSCGCGAAACLQSEMVMDGWALTGSFTVN